MNTTKHLMIDCETLSLAPDALIWEVGVVPFEVGFNENACPVLTAEVGRRFVMNPEEIRDAGMPFDVSADTVQWTRKHRPAPEIQRYLDFIWACYSGRQNGLVGEDWRPQENLPVSSVLELAAYLAANTEKGVPGTETTTYIWCRNAAFDFPRIEYMFSKYGLKLPWHRRAQCDVYTAVNLNFVLGGELELPAVRQESEHSALADCYQQIAELADALGAILKQNK